MPFYYYKMKSFCYLNQIHKESANDLCFMKGHLLKNHNDKMIDKDAKLFASLRCAYLKKHSQ
ncbi:MAG: hypothetical protein ACI924_002115 [Flavobacterium sp.]|jgi:hypothetical protein